MDYGNNNLLAAAEVVAQALGAVGPSHQVLQPLEGYDIVPYLCVEVHAVGHHDDAVEQRLCAVQQAHQLIGQPGDGVRLARACRVLD